jgi:hypothetical protein
MGCSRSCFDRTVGAAWTLPLGIATAAAGSRALCHTGTATTRPRLQNPDGAAGLPLNGMLSSFVHWHWIGVRERGNALERIRGTGADREA